MTVGSAKRERGMAMEVMKSALEERKLSRYPRGTNDGIEHSLSGQRQRLIILGDTLFYVALNRT